MASAITRAVGWLDSLGISGPSAILVERKLVMEFTDFIQEFSEWWKTHLSRSIVHDCKSWRMGQAYFNFLLQHRPDLAQRVRGSLFDPFNRDETIPMFLSWLEREWENYGKCRYCNSEYVREPHEPGCVF